MTSCSGRRRPACPVRQATSAERFGRPCSKPHEHCPSGVHRYRAGPREQRGVARAASSDLKPEAVVPLAPARFNANQVVTGEWEASCPGATGWPWQGLSGRVERWDREFVTACRHPACAPCGSDSVHPPSRGWDSGGSVHVGPWLAGPVLGCVLGASSCSGVCIYAADGSSRCGSRLTN